MGQNATYLFEKPFRRFHNAEPWWTAFFTMLVLWRETQHESLVLPSYNSDQLGQLTKKCSISFAGASYANLVADARLNGEPFGIGRWPNEYLNLRPDITYIKSKEHREVVFVETKTIGASVQGNIELYEGLIGFLRQEGWAAEFYYLLSLGHEQTRDWSLLADVSANVITWEDVFSAAKGSPFSDLFGEPLAKYIC